ncbi:MAG: HD domain-containing protein [Bacteroidetes bacterium]|nr:HD domain-containing protein [Bacteroidota bacterium]
MALAYLVYPGAVHTRLHHSLGAYHLMGLALNELKAKGVEITDEEMVAAKAAILLHDVGHGPFSHALEEEFLSGIHHEELSVKMMKKMNREFNGELDLAIKIFTNQYHKKFLHQLVSGQLDVDRMDYLTRDSYFTGVSEGVIGYDRILKMLVVHNNELMVEEKGIYSIEKFLIARRLMYWQAYLHKAVLCSEKMLVNILKRVKYLCSVGDASIKTTSGTDYFLFEFDGNINDDVLDKFAAIDDIDFEFAIKKWSINKDFVLSNLCKRILNRDLLKLKFQINEIDKNEIDLKQRSIANSLHISLEEASYFIFSGSVSNTIYNTNKEKINILFKDGSVVDISLVNDALIHQTITTPVKKNYICSI